MYIYAQFLYDKNYNHWKFYTNQPSTAKVSQETGRHQALLMATSEHSLPPLVILQRWPLGQSAFYNHSSLDEIIAVICIYCLLVGCI